MGKSACLAGKSTCPRLLDMVFVEPRLCIPRCGAVLCKSPCSVHWVCSRNARATSQNTQFFFRSSSLTFNLVIGLFPEWIRSNGKESGCGDHQHQALLREAGLTTCPAVCLAPLLCRLPLPKFPHPLPLPHSLGMQETPTHHQYQPRPLQRVLCHPHPHFLVSQFHPHPLVFHPHPLEFHLHSHPLVCHPHHHLLASEVQAWALEMELEWSSAGSHLFDQVGKPGSLVPAAPP